jgi:hypothetical protein
MYSKQEASQLNQEFWTSLGQYMSPIPSAEGGKINWINYKTGVKNFRIVMKAANKTASIAIELSHKEPGLQQSDFEKLAGLKNVFEMSTQSSWDWKLLEVDVHEKMVSTVSAKLENVSVLNKNDWPTLISIFKTHLVSLDKFWSEYRFIFEL